MDVVCILVMILVWRICTIQALQASRTWLASTPRHPKRLVACRGTCSHPNDGQAIPLVCMEVNGAGKPDAVPSAVARLTLSTLQAPGGHVQLRLCEGAAVRHAVELHLRCFNSKAAGLSIVEARASPRCVAYGAADSTLNRFHTHCLGWNAGPRRN